MHKVFPDKVALIYPVCTITHGPNALNSEFVC